MMRFTARATTVGLLLGGVIRRRRLRASSTVSVWKDLPNTRSPISSRERSLRVTDIFLVAAPSLEAARYRACAPRRAGVRSRSSIFRSKLLVQHFSKLRRQAIGRYWLLNELVKSV